MSSLVRSDGIVLRHLRHGESSLILMVFMREFGKIGLMAKGVRGTRKLGSAAALQLFSEAQFIYYRKPGRDLQMFKEASPSSAHLALRNNLELMSVASAVVELLSKCLREEDSHPDLYDHASETLALLDTAPPSPLPVLWRFEMELFQALGFELQLERCAETALPLTPPFSAGIRYRLSEGSFLHPSATVAASRDGALLPETFAMLVRVAHSSREFAGGIMISARVGQEIESFFARYLETHLPVRGHLKSLQALNWNHPSSEPSPPSIQTDS